MRKFSVQDLTLAALLAAVYATLTLVLPIPAFTGIQIRMSEALTVLPFLFPAATPGLFVGCIVANLFSPYPLDIVCGSAATLLACLLTQRMPSRWLSRTARSCPPLPYSRPMVIRICFFMRKHPFCTPSMVMICPVI